MVITTAASAVRFAFATITSHWLGERLAGSRFRLPHLTGYLLGGFVAGPSGINLVTSGALRQLAFLNGVALAAIAFSAGTEIYLPDIKPHWRLIVSQLSMICITTMVGCACVVMAIRPWVPYISSVGLQCQWQMALLCGTIMIARSPSTALALIQALFARGDLTTLCMGITVVSDAILLVVFAVVNSLATAECMGAGIDHWSFVALCVSVFGSITFGWVIGKLLVGAMWLPLIPDRAKGVLILGAGSLVFIGSRYLEATTHTSLHHTFRFEPLLVCIAASCFACHTSSKRHTLSVILRKTSLLAFLPFFTLTGAAFNVRNLGPILPLSLALFLTRLVAIWLGSWAALGCIHGGAAPDLTSKATNLWMTLTTQAGAAIGLANELAQTFNPWGPSLADAIAVVVILNQITGPFIFRYALRCAGEDRSPKIWLDRDVAVFGVNRAALAIGSRLCQSGCRVRLVRPDAVAASFIQTQIQTVLDALKRTHGDDTFHMALAADPLPTALDCARAGCGLRHGRCSVDLDYCPPLDLKCENAAALETPLLRRHCEESSTDDVTALVERLIPVECATAILSFDEDAVTLRVATLITSLTTRRTIPRLVAVVHSQSTATALSRLGVVVVHGAAALADLATALALTHSSEGVTLLMPGKFSVREVRDLIRAVDCDDGEAIPVVDVEERKVVAVDDWAVPMTNRAAAAWPRDLALTNDWIWFRQEMSRRRTQMKRAKTSNPPPSWVSLG